VGETCPPPASPRPTAAAPHYGGCGAAASRSCAGSGGVARARGTTRAGPSAARRQRPRRAGRPRLRLAYGSRRPLTLWVLSARDFSGHGARVYSGHVLGPRLGPYTRATAPGYVAAGWSRRVQRWCRLVRPGRWGGFLPRTLFAAKSTFPMRCNLRRRGLCSKGSRVGPVQKGVHRVAARRPPSLGMLHSCDAVLP
jgi:hypothetical protein